MTASEIKSIAKDLALSVVLGWATISAILVVAGWLVKGF